MIDKTKCSWPTKPIQIILISLKGSVFLVADLNSAYNQKPLDTLTEVNMFRYCRTAILHNTKRMSYSIFIGPAAFYLFLSSLFKPLIRKTMIIILDDVFIQGQTTETMLET